MAPLRYSAKADAYLEWAVHTGFLGFGGIQPDAPMNDRKIGLLVKWKKQNAPQAPANFPVLWARVYQSQPIAVVCSDPTWLASDEGANWLTHEAECAELATPVAEYPNAPAFVTHHGTFAMAVAPIEPTLVMACIDDAFPIAQPWLAARVRRLWNQGLKQRDANRLGWRVPGTADLLSANFGYGAELTRATPSVLPTPADARDDQSYYRRVGLTALRVHSTHGAHVLDAMAGPVPLRHRMSPDRDSVLGRPGQDGNPPTRKPVADAASQAPLILVQLPKHAVDDPTGRWLGSHVLDGLHYVLLASQGAKKVVVNLSWGPQTGPHDGSSLLEQAIDDLSAKACVGGRELFVTLPAGNSFQARAHAHFSVATGCDSLVWVVPPGNQTSTFLEVWWPSLAAHHAALTVTAPDGQSMEISADGIVTMNGTAWGITRVTRRQRTMALLALAPTFSHQAGTFLAPHGHWKLQIQGLPGAEGHVDVYVARADPNLGGKRTSTNSYLLDPLYEDMRRKKVGATPPAESDSPVKREGTLNGLATGQATGVAGGYRMSDGAVSEYSSSGPSSGARSGPDWLYPTDESKALPGVRTGAVRAGSVGRLVGTSMAAPQFARELANGTVPQPNPPLDIRTGAGRR